MSVTRVLLIAIVTLAAACEQAPTRPTIPEQPPNTTVPPSPSPSPTYGSISGNWTGTFNVSDIDSDCSFFNPASASASFTQQDDRVHGTLSVVYACWPTEGGVAFDGVNDAGTLRGTTLSRGNSPAKPLERSREMRSNCRSRTCGIRRELPQSSQQA